MTFWFFNFLFRFCSFISLLSFDDSSLASISSGHRLFFHFSWSWAAVLPESARASIKADCFKIVAFHHSLRSSANYTQLCLLTPFSRQYKTLLQQILNTCRYTHGLVDTVHGLYFVIIYTWIFEAYSVFTNIVGKREKCTIMTQDLWGRILLARCVPIKEVQLLYNYFKYRILLNRARPRIEPTPDSSSFYQ